MDKNKNSLYPQTKVNLPEKFLINIKKIKKEKEIKKDKKQITVNSREYVENERERIKKILTLFDIKDTNDD